MTAREYPPALGPKGVMMSVRTRQGQLLGELIEVRDAGIVLADQKLRFLPYTAILSSEVDKTGSLYAAISKGAVPERGVQERLRLLSRFPQGLTPELVRQLLEVTLVQISGLTPEGGV